MFRFLSTTSRPLACVAAVALIAAAAAAQAAPDHVAKIAVSNGTVKVANIGPSGIKKRSIVSVDCVYARLKKPVKKSRGGCPEPRPRQAKPYKFPGVSGAAIKVPPLKAGQSYTHTIAFFNSLNWQPGTYGLKVCADAAGHIPEGNEANNCKVFKKIVP